MTLYEFMATSSNTPVFADTESEARRWVYKRLSPEWEREGLVRFLDAWDGTASGGDPATPLLGSLAKSYGVYRSSSGQLRLERYHRKGNPSRHAAAETQP